MPIDTEKLKKLQKMKVARISGGMRRKLRSNQKMKKYDLDFWKIANKFDIHSVPNIKQIILVKNDKSTIEINNPLVKTVSKGNTTIVYKSGKHTTIKQNAPIKSIKLEGIDERVINKHEKKTKKLLSKINMKNVEDINKAIIKTPNINFYIKNPEIYKIEKQLLYVIYGKQEIEDLLAESSDTDNIYNDKNEENNKNKENDKNDKNETMAISN